MKNKSLVKTDKLILKEKLKKLKQDYKNSKKNITKELNDIKTNNISQEDVFDLCLKNK